MVKQDLFRVSGMPSLNPGLYVGLTLSLYQSCRLADCLGLLPTLPAVLLNQSVILKQNMTPPKICLIEAIAMISVMT